MKKIVSMGRGGVGKSSFLAGLARVLKNDGPLLLIDADPDRCLAEMVGIDLEGEEAKTISDILFDIKSECLDEKLKSMTMTDKVDYLLNQNGLCEGESFDLLSLGTKWTEGCYCRPNYVLKEVLDRIAKNYRYVLVDSPAGLEHLNRRIMSSVDDIFLLISPTKKAFSNAKRSMRLIEEIGIKYGNFYLICNHDFQGEMPETLLKNKDFQCIGRIERDAEVARFNLEGKPLLGLKDDSPFLNSIRIIAHKAGYLT